MKPKSAKNNLRKNRRNKLKRKDTGSIGNKSRKKNRKDTSKNKKNVWKGKREEK